MRTCKGQRGVPVPSKHIAVMYIDRRISSAGKQHLESGLTDSYVVGIENFQTGLRTKPPESGRSMHRSLKTTSKSPRELVALGKLETLPTASSSDLVK